MSNVSSNLSTYNFIDIEGGVSLPYLFLEPAVVKDEDTVIIFLHEGLGSIPQWKDFPQKVCEMLQLRGVVYEREGYGTASPFRSKRGVDYLEKYALEELPQFIDELLPDKNIILFGHSDGGSIALIYASAFPQKVKGIVTEAAHIFVEDITVIGIKKALQTFDQSPKLQEALAKYHGDKTVDLFYAWAKTWLTPEFFKWNIVHDLHKITAPALIIQGYYDEYGSPQQVEIIVEKTTGKAQPLLLKDCGHSPHKDREATVLNETKTFIDGIYQGQ